MLVSPRMAPSFAAVLMVWVQAILTTVAEQVATGIPRPKGCSHDVCLQTGMDSSLQLLQATVDRAGDIKQIDVIDSAENRTRASQKTKRTSGPRWPKLPYGANLAAYGAKWRAARERARAVRKARAGYAGVGSMPGVAGSGVPIDLYKLGTVPGYNMSHVPFMGEEEFQKDSALSDAFEGCFPKGAKTTKSYRNVTTPQLIPFYVSKEDPQHSGAAVIFVPGGGRYLLMVDPVFTTFLGDARAMGITVFFLKYRVPTETCAAGFDCQVADLQRAVSLVRSRAAEFALDPNRIGVFGASAGGELAVSVSVAGAHLYPRIDAIDDASSKPSFTLAFYAPIDDYAMGPAAGNAPPMLLTVGLQDACVSPDRIIAFYGHLQRFNSFPSELFVYDKGSHGYGVCPATVAKGDSTCMPRSVFESFLHRHVGVPQKRFAKPQQLHFTEGGRIGDSFWCPPKIVAPDYCQSHLEECTGHCDEACFVRCGAPVYRDIEYVDPLTPV